MFAFISPTVTHSPFGAQDDVARDASMRRIDSSFFRWRGRLPGLDRFPVLSVSALCVEDSRASIGVAVHRFGKCAKVFLERKIHRLKKVQRKEGRSMLRHYKRTKKTPLV
jgi:hypothetical protein